MTALIKKINLNQENLEQSEILSWEEIVQKYPNQSVLIIDYETDEAFNIKQGKVIAHANERDEIYDQLHLRQGKPCAIEYTGDLSQEIFIPV
jgi:hypothetical protein